MQEQRSRWERPKNYFAPQIKSEIILPAVACDRCPLSKQSTGLFRNSPLAERTLCFVGLCPTPCKPFAKGLTENFSFLDRV